MDLPKPACELGYTTQQVAEITGARLPEFLKWFFGQTGAICEGRRYNHKTKKYEKRCGGVAHGHIVYAHDLERFLGGLVPFD